MTSEIKERIVYLMRRTDRPDDGTDIYVGSTSLSLKLRLQLHRSKAKICDSKLYVKMREVGVNNWEMVPLLSFTCDKKTILEFEKEWCNALNADLNSNSSFSGFENKQEYFSNYCKLNKQNKTHHCNVCEKSFESNKHLQRHFDSLKHLHTYLNSLD